jgi:hypothetical protein
MKLFASRSARRAVTRAVVLFWLFALASGWANACVLQSRGTHLHGPTKVGEELFATGVSAGHVGAVAGHTADAEADARQAPCLKFCDDESQCLPKLTADIDLADPDMAPLATVEWGTSSTLVPQPVRRFGAMPPIAAPPIRLRFSRLAL